MQTLQGTFLIAVIAILLFSFQGYAQDEIVLRVDEKPLDYELKIIEVKDDSIYFKAFWKIKQIALSEVESYTQDGKKISGYTLTAAQKEKKELYEKQLDSVEYIRLPSGAYMTFGQLINQQPALLFNFEIIRRTKRDIQKHGGNTFEISSKIDTITKEIVKKKIYAISTGDSLYLNCSQLKLQSWYAKVFLATNNYFVFKAGVPEEESARNRIYAAIRGGIIGGPLVGAVQGGLAENDLALKRYLYIMKLPEGKISILNKNFFRENFANKPDLLNIFNNELDKESEVILVKYAKILILHP